MKFVKKNIDLLNGNILKSLTELAVPIMATSLVQTAYNLTDMAWIGMVGSDAVAAVGAAAMYTWLSSGVVTLARMGGQVKSAHAYGEGNRREVIQYGKGALQLALVLAAAYGLLTNLLADPLIGFFHLNSPQVVADAITYLRIACGFIVFAFIGQTLTGLYTASGNSRTPLMANCIGRGANIILDPIFIFGLHMDVQGAALATVLSQFASAAWILKFLTGSKAILRLKRENMRLKASRVKKIVSMGMSSFMAGFTNSLVAVACNATLQAWGGDLYVGVMTVLHSVREIAENMVKGLTGGSQPVLGYNYGAGEYDRVKQAIKFVSAATISFTVAAWILISAFPEFFIQIFNRDEGLVAAAIPSIRLYFFGFFMMSLQFSGQACFIGLGKAKQAAFFSVFRKVIIVLPLTLLLPHVAGLGPMGVFLAEPVSNFVGGAACYGTMIRTVWPELGRKKEKEEKA